MTESVSNRDMVVAVFVLPSWNLMNVIFQIKFFNTARPYFEGVVLTNIVF